MAALVIRKAEPISMKVMILRALGLPEESRDGGDKENFSRGYTIIIVLIKYSIFNVYIVIIKFFSGMHVLYY